MQQKRSSNFCASYGPWAVVAGASAGLGAEFATQLARKGLNLVLIARRKELMEELAEQLRNEYAREVRILPLDLARDDIETIIAEATSDLDIGLLVSIAALSVVGPFFEQPLHDHVREIAVNCHAPLVLSYLFGRRMLTRRHGGIVLMSSLTSSQGTPLAANYGATKAYSRILAEGLWEELRKQGIDVLVCAAGAIRTPTYLASLPDHSRSGISSVSLLSPRTVANEVLAALGHRPLVIPGWKNRLGNLFLQRFLPHQLAIKFMGYVMRNVYGYPLMR